MAFPPVAEKQGVILYFKQTNPCIFAVSENGIQAHEQALIILMFLFLGFSLKGMGHTVHGL